jgi:hypothetical protein
MRTTNPTISCRLSPSAHGPPRAGKPTYPIFNPPLRYGFPDCASARWNKDRSRFIRHPGANVLTTQPLWKHNSDIDRWADCINLCL